MDMNTSSGDMSADMMATLDMQMTFFSATNTSLYSDMWTPSTTSGYAGTCIFLIFLAIAFRSLFAFKHVLESRWHMQAVNRRYIVVAGKGSEAGRPMSPDAKSAVLSVNGIEESVHVVERPSHNAPPWRFSVDLPRAALVTIMAANGYLLMLAVMTFNIGYFFSILAGTFVGESIVGRYNTAMSEH